MKKGFLTLAVAMATTSSAMMMLAKDNSQDVLMTINGKAVTLGEFEYLYHKNNSQQLNAQSIDDYLQMFVTYKQKVADAEAEGIDKTTSFQNEFAGYRQELSEPYLRVQEVEDSLINVEYARMKEEVDVSHIMLANHGENINPDEQRLRLDSIRSAILAGSDFETLARQFSIDRSVVRNGGRMGFITAGRYPYSFETAAYTTPVGNISDVIETPFGFHIVKVNDRRAARGQVSVEHILKLTQGLNETAAAAKKAQIDSIATLLANGGNFEEIARAESEDPGSKNNGGKLQWFGTGMMVPEFEAAAFALADGETSEPVKTSYGYHIIRKLGHRDVDSLENVTPAIKKAMAQDERGKLPYKRKVEQLRSKFKAQINKKNFASLSKTIQENGGVDSVLQAKLAASNLTIASYGKTKIPVSEVISSMPMPLPAGADNQIKAISLATEGVLNNDVVDAERNELATTNADYRNLLNEYRDGMLLFEVSDRKVWTKAKQDKEGLEAYFNANRSKYNWDGPRFKSYVVFATSDSLLTEANKFLAANNIPSDSLSNSIRQQFGKEVKVEKVIAAKGENAITDYLAFGGDKPESKGKWAFYFKYRDKILNAPEEAADVRGTVTGDYQAMLEEEWIEQLKQKYPAKINNKVLEKAK
jgi:peptidyl-prolyl cis-trans isomerase SurA